jgi:hypothetical protein
MNKILVTPGQILEIEPEDIEPVDYTFFDCWSESGDENSPMYDFKSNGACIVMQETLRSWSKTLNVPQISPDFLAGPGAFANTYIVFGFSQILEDVIKKIIQAGYSVYESDTRVEIYRTEDLKDSLPELFMVSKSLVCDNKPTL